MSELRVEQFRGGSLESVHRIHAAVVDCKGTAIAYAGNPQYVSFMRSAAKPLQALPLIKDGVVEEFAITAQELALACASHNSEVEHVELVASFLARLGYSEGDLACGPHKSLLPELDSHPQDAECEPTLAPESKLASNCSGKHTGMLALAKHHEWPSDGYHQKDHPVQRRCLAEISQWSDVPEGDIGCGVDGCGVVTFALPLRNMALAYARLAAQESEPERRVFAAMTAHPHLVAGTRRLCTELMRAYAGEVVAKVGAGGVYLAALLDSKLGIALKVEDSNARAAEVALLRVLAELGVPDVELRLEAFAHPRVYNTRGEVVGSVCSVGGLAFSNTES